MSRLDVRRRIREERDYERSQMPDPEKVRLGEMRYSLDRSRNNPPSGDIWSAVALNDLLQAGATMQRNGLYGPAVPIAPDVLAHVSVTTGTTRGSIGVLNDGQPLRWPFTLRGTSFKEERTAVDKLAAELVAQAKSTSGVEPETLRAAQAAVDKMDNKLKGAVEDLTPDEFISSRRFVNQLKDSLKTLQDPNASEYFRKWTPRGNSVPELIDEMSRQGLRFAAAAVGSEPFYTMLYQSMITYDNALARAAGAAALTSAPAPPR
jgi:hypothetical protein